MADTNPIKYSDLVAPDQSIENLIKQLGQLQLTYEHLYDTVVKDSQKMAAALKSVSGATSEGRKTISESSKEADRLAQAHEKLKAAQSETAQEIARLNELTRQQNQANKENAKLTYAQEGSYNALSATYSKLKRELNNMNPVTAEAKKLFAEKQKEAKALYERMNELQKATGKFTLQVGNYNIAGESMKNVIMQGKAALAEMALQGKANTKEYAQLKAQVANLTDTFKDTTAAINAMASDTYALDVVLQGMAVGTGGFAAVTGAMQLFGGESKEVEEAQKQLQAAIAMVNGVTAIQNALQKQSALVQALKSLQTKILSKFTKENTAVTATNTAAVTAQTTATKAATTATNGFGKALKAIKANPIIAAIALLAAGIGVVVAVVKNHRAEQKKLYEQQLKTLEASEAARKVAMQVHETEISNIQQRIKLAEAEGKSEDEILKLREEEFIEQSQMAARNTAWYKQEIDHLDENKKKRVENKKLLQDEAAGTIKLGKYKIEEIKAENDLLDRQIEIAEQQVEVNKELEVTAIKLAEQKRQLAIDTAKAEEDSLRNLQDARNSLIKNQFAREWAQTKANYDRQIADLKTTLENERNLTATQRKNMNALIVELGKQKNAAMAEIEKQEQAANLAAVQATEQMRINLMAEGSQKQQAVLLANYEKEKTALENQLKEKETLTVTQQTELNNQLILLQAQFNKDSEKLAQERIDNELNQELKAIELRSAAVVKGQQKSTSDAMRAIEIRRQLELSANAKLAEELRQSESDINAKYDAEKLKTQDELMKQIADEQMRIQQELANSEIDIMQTSEKNKTTLRLQLEKERLEKVLELNEAANIKMSEEERKTIENQIAKISQDIEKNKKPTDLYEVLGLDLTDEEKEGFNESLQYAKDAIAQFLDYKLQVSQQAVDAANREVEAAQNVLNTERAARAAGYANNVAMAEKELAAAKNQQRKALKQQQETQKAQQRLQSIEQAVNMITATAKIFGSMPIYLAIPAIALMWGAFAASKIKANQLKTEQYGDGTVELLQGGSHQSGNDIDLGTKKDGTRRRAEGGEYFAVINRKSSRKYRKEIPNIINALNKGNFAEKYAAAYNGGTAVIANFDGKAELTSIAKNIGEMNERSKAATVIYTVDGRVEKRGNITRIIKN